MAYRKSREINCQYCYAKLPREIACGTCGLILCRICTCKSEHHCQMQEIKIEINDLNNVNDLNNANNENIDSICAIACNAVENSKDIPTNEGKIAYLKSGLLFCKTPQARAIFIAELNLLNASGVPVE